MGEPRIVKMKETSFKDISEIIFYWTITIFLIGIIVCGGFAYKLAEKNDNGLTEYNEELIVHNQELREVISELNDSVNYEKLKNLYLIDSNEKLKAEEEKFEKENKISVRLVGYSEVLK